MTEAASFGADVERCTLLIALIPIVEIAPTFLTAIIAIKGGVEILRDARTEGRQAREANQ